MAAADRARSRMVDALRAAGRLRTPVVEAAFRAVPRHLFLPDHSYGEAYADEAVAVQRVDGVATSSASQPSMMAIMLEQLALRPGHRVLEIGTGTGYNAALMARIVGPAGAVTSVDIDEDLVRSAAGHLVAAGTAGVRLACADGAFGHPPGAPFDRIILTVGAADIRPEWTAQLAEGGRLLLPLAVRGSQLSVALDLGPDGALRSASVRSCAFIRLRGVAAGPDPAVPLPAGGLLLQAPDDTMIDPGAVAAALTGPASVRPVGIELGPADVWDGFGLWLAVREPGTCRLLFPGADPDDLGPGGEVAAALFPNGAGSAALALTGAAGLAVVVQERAQRWAEPAPATVRAFGAGGVELAGRLVERAAEWAAAGRPTAAELSLVVAPTLPAASLEPDGPGVADVVDKFHCRLLVSWAGRRRG